MPTILTPETAREADALEDILSEVVPTSRRSMLKKGALAASALALATAWLGSAQKARAQGAGKTDREMLMESAILERQAINTYTAAAGLKDSSGQNFVSGDVLSVAVAFIGDHTYHRDRFDELAVELGGQASVATEETTLMAFPPGPNSQLTSLPGVLRYALAVEIYAAKLWFQYFKDAQDLRTKRLFADIAPNEAAHAAILRAALKFIASVPTDHDSTDPGKAVVPFTQLSFDSPVF